MPPIDFSFIDKYTKYIAKASRKSHPDKGYQYFLEVYLHNTPGMYSYVFHLLESFCLSIYLTHTVISSYYIM